MLLSAARSKAIVVLRRILRAIYSVRLLKYPELRGLLKEFASSQSAAVDSGEAISLFEHVVKRKPQALIELGPGTSTAVLALAIRAVKKEDPGYKPVFIAIEENPDWLAYHRKTIPPHLSAHVDLRTEEAVADVLESRPVARFKTWEPATAPFEFVHVDGPDHFSLGSDVTSDVITFIDKLAPRCVVVFDGREKSARLARPYLEKAGFSTRRHPFTLAYTFIRG